jgi:hypothetical protein
MIFPLGFNCFMRGAAVTFVRHILDQKGRHVWSVPSDGTVYDAIKLMADKKWPPGELLRALGLGNSEK